MNDITVGIVGANRERHCLYLSRELNRQGARPIVLDNSPDAPFSLSLRNGSGFFGEIPLNETEVYYMRALFLPTPAFDPEPIAEQLRQDGYAAFAAERERYATWLSWLKIAGMQEKLVVNPIDSLLLHFAKPFQTELLRKRGFPVPETLVTSSAERLLSFCAGREVVYKPVAGGALCRRLQEADKRPERLETLASAPVQFQEYIPGADWRIFVLDGRAIASFKMEGDGLDYREGETKAEYRDASPDIAELCVRACRALGLIFSGVDVKVRPDGTAVLLECNPSPMFEGFDQAAPAPIVSRLAAYLIDEARRRRRSSPAGVSAHG